MHRTERSQLQQRLFPGGIPRLWCPTLTYFRAAHALDPQRTAAHLERLAPFVRGVLVPGSTGEGWEMNDREIRQLLETVLPCAARLGMRTLIGILKFDTPEMLAAIDQLKDLIEHPAAVGITVCPPRGAGLDQMKLADSLRRVLERQLPTAIYQLPQVTQNELAPETLAKLADEFPNWFMFKDTSGEDRVALSGVDLQGVFMVRGSERGGYAKWTRGAGGPYDGFLLSTANCYAAELAQIIELLDRGELAAAQQLSARLEQIVAAAFELVQDFPSGNPFTNANKILDHIQVHGDQAATVPAPLLISGA
ncbi:MAG: dihydrodipicolinate synthase family protein, partial [Aureliella sp.]